MIVAKSVITSQRSHARQSFLTRHASEVKGTLSGLDRVRFRGTLRWLANTQGMGAWLHRANVWLKDFKGAAMRLTETIKQATQQLAERDRRPVESLASSSIRKEDDAKDIAQRDGVTSGLVCVLSAVEPCITFTVGPNRQAMMREVRRHEGKCLHQYFDLIDPQLGWLNVRLQTWFPLTVQVVINGREWLSRQLVKKGIPFERRENGFVDIADLPAAQRLMDRQSRTHWPRLLNRLRRRVHPSHQTLFAPERLAHSWSVDETEWATDVMFRSPEALARLSPRLVRHAMTHFDCTDVLRFLGKSASVQQFTAAEMLTHLARRPEGVRLKHALDRNSIKMSDKQQTLLRVETTINHPRAMKVDRASEDDPNGPQSWQKLRKGVADLHRRTQINQSCNERYLEALASVEAEATLAETAAEVCRRTRWKGRPVPRPTAAVKWPKSPG